MTPHFSLYSLAFLEIPSYLPSSLSLDLTSCLSRSGASVSFTNACDRVRIFCAMLLLKGTVHFTDILLYDETFVYTAITGFVQMCITSTPVRTGINIRIYVLGHHTTYM